MSIKPLLVPQSDTQRCWAACMESWTASAWYWHRITQSWFASQYADNANGGLKTGSDKYNLFLLTYDLKEYIAPAGGLSQKVAEQWLDFTSYFIVIMQTGTDSSHAMLAYDCSGNTLSVMDPARGFVTGSLDTLGRSLCLHYHP